VQYSEENTIQISVQDQIEWSERRQALRTTIWLAVLLVVLGAVFVLSTVRRDATVRSISSEEAMRRLEAGENVVLLDVRTPEEHAESRIPDSVLLPLDELERRVPEVLPDKRTTLFVYCRSGRRSRIAADMLVKMGYTRVYDLGGIVDWPYAISGRDQP